MTSDHLLQTALHAATEAGKAIMDIYSHPATDWEIEHKADNSPLTLADRRAHAVIIRLLADTPYPVLSEEGTKADYAVRRAWKRLWIVDPLDGTKEFIKRNGEFTVNIALVEDGRPVMGVVLAPAIGKTYWGVTAAFNGKAQAFCSSAAGDGRLSTPRSLPLAAPRDDRYVIVASRSHQSPATAAFIEEARHTHPQVELRAAGSSLKICMVAEGSADVYPRLAPTMEWDTAAGHAVAEAAGCDVIDADTGLAMTYNKPDLHNPFFIVRRAAQ